MKIDKKLLHPRHWPLWVGIFIFYCFCKLPHAWCMKMSGWVGYKIIKGSRKEKIIHRNLELCFPEKTDRERSEIAIKNMHSYGQMIYEAGHVWWSSDKKFFSNIKCNGLENYDDAIAQGKGVVKLGLHLATIEVAARIPSQNYKFGIMRQNIKNPILNYFIQKKVNQYYDWCSVSARSALKILKKNKTIVYLPDLNIKSSESIFVPFFGIKAATSPAISLFSGYKGSPVVPMSYYRDNGRYIMMFYPALKNFPTGDAYQDMSIINKIIEEHIRKCPEQYMWHLKRFKTRPEGEPDLYEGI